MLAQRLPTILPPMNAKEALEISTINSVAGLLGENGLCITRPFRSPHHTASQAALTGGGLRARPGEVSLAHNGVLFLDELPEFSGAALDSLRQPLEAGIVTVARANGHITYPAKFQLVAAMNPCKSGHFGDPSRACASAPLCALKYQNRISGPMYDRIDLTVEVENINPWELENMKPSEDSASVRARVLRAREFQARRIAKSCGKKDDGRDGIGAAGSGAAGGEAGTVFGGGSGLLNANLSGRQIEESGNFESSALDLLVKSASRLKLSARGYYKTMRIARTIADMDGREAVLAADVAEALAFRRKM
jgi:magnesium chelatase family protein